MSNSITIPSYQEGLAALQDNLATMLPAEALATFSKDADTLQAEHTSVLNLNVGDVAPDFTLSNARGENISLRDLLERGRVVLTFYRGSWCPYCNLQLNQYQSALTDMQALDAQLVAISPQIPDESLNIKEKNELAFEVLSDNGNMVAKKFTKVFKNGEAPLEAMANLGIDFDSHYADDSKELPVPAVFIIEKDGTVSFAQAEGGDYRNRVEASTIINSLK